MTNFIENVSFCDVHGYYHGAADSCAGCIGGSTYYVTIDSLTDKPQSPKNEGLVTPVDFGEVSPPKSAKGNKSAKNIRAKDFGYIPSLFEYKEVFKKSSGVEYRRYKYLFELEQRGTIHILTLQPEYELIPRTKTPANDVHPKFTSGHEIYTPDFSYIWRTDYQIIEDAKGGKMVDVTKDGKPTGEKRLTPYVKAAARSKHKALLHDISNIPYTVFVLTVWHKSRWHYFNANRKEFDFRLECE